MCPSRLIVNPLGLQLTADGTVLVRDVLKLLHEFDQLNMTIRDFKTHIL